MKKCNYYPFQSYDQVSDKERYFWITISKKTLSNKINLFSCTFLPRFCLVKHSPVLKIARACQISEILSEVRQKLRL